MDSRADLGKFAANGSPERFQTAEPPHGERESSVPAHRRLGLHHNVRSGEESLSSPVVPQTPQREPAENRRVAIRGFPFALPGVGALMDQIIPLSPEIVQSIPRVDRPVVNVHVESTATGGRAHETTKAQPLSD